jgi:hypothetical protein
MEYEGSIGDEKNKIKKIAVVERICLDDTDVALKARKLKFWLP